MKETNTLVEYGAPIDTRTMVAPPDVTELELEAGTPRLWRRRIRPAPEGAVRPCREHRLKRLGPPMIDYTAGRDSHLARSQPEAARTAASSMPGRMYLQAKRDARDQAETRSRNSGRLSERFDRETRHSPGPRRGAMPYRTFYEYIADRGFPVTQFIRHGSHPEFTPEPDMIHDCLGHVPPLMNHDYAELLTLIGKAAATTRTGDQVLALKRFSWFSIEFGLIEEAEKTKIFGAGILSSTGEIPYSRLVRSARRPFVTDVVIATDYDPSRMQDQFVRGAVVASSCGGSWRGWCGGSGFR